MLSSFALHFSLRLYIEGLHCGLRCGNKDRDRLVNCAKYLGVADYDAVLKEISPRLTPFGVMGFDGGALWLGGAS